LKNHKPERLILKIPKWLWKLLSLPSIAFCMTRNRAVIILLAFISVGFFNLIIFSYFPLIPLILKIVVTSLWVIFFSLIILLFLPTIFIRKDCFECKFGFYIIAHERNHLLLRKSEEIVEQETLKQNTDLLIPILLSNLKTCKGCRFMGRKMYCEATFNYLKQSEKKLL